MICILFIHFTAKTTTQIRGPECFGMFFTIKQINYNIINIIND